MKTNELGHLGDDVRCFVQGASRGIGFGLVRRLLDAPNVATVFASSRSATSSDPLARLVDEHGERLQLIDLDVTDEVSIQSAARLVAETGTELHFLFNVTGLLHDDATGMTPEKSLRDIDPDQLARSFAVNATGPILMAKHFHAFFRHGRRAVWANMSARVGSIGDNGLGGWYAYRASKAAQNMFTRTMSIELRRKAPQTIVVALHPGTVDTELSEPFQRNVPDERLFTVERAVDRLLEVISGLEASDSGGFFAWDGSPIEW